MCTKQRLLQLFFVVSVLLNIFILIAWSNQPSYKIGILLHDVEVADYANDSRILFKLPKGITVMNVSPRGLATVGLFDSERFSFTITVSDSELINYSSIPDGKSPYAALYQVAKVHQN